MKKTHWQCIVGVALCAMMAVVTAGTKRTVERPFKAHGYTIVAIDLSELSPGEEPGVLKAPWSVVDEVGLGTHTGRWTSEGEGTVFFQMDASGLIPVAIGGSGSITVASGDVIGWESVGNVITFVNGTGRFSNVSGSFTEAQTIMDEVLEGPFLILTIQYTGSGAISY